MHGSCSLYKQTLTKKNCGGGGGTINSKIRVLEGITCKTQFP